ncbi:hypothetical protein EJ02DRAFT_460722, partial [Clathrospora elynae]
LDLLCLGFLDLGLLCFLLFYVLMYTCLSKLPRRPHNSTTIILLALLKVKDLALLLVLLFG